MSSLPRFAATKIQPPRPAAGARAARLPRPALHAALQQALSQARVVLLQAPAGFGKTSALAAALPADAALAWVSLDADDDAPTLLACLVAALEAHDLPWRIAPELLPGLPGDSRGTPSRAVAELVNALADAQAARGVIVLDDLHRVQDAALFRALDLLIERMPAHWTLVLCTRVEPPLALARLRVADALASFGQDELAFAADETAALAAAAGLDAAAAAALHERTAGWPAGVRLGLAARTVGGAPPTRLDRPLFDFLASEVIADLPAPLHEFLLRTSVLPELTAASAAAVSGDAQADERLEEVERRGLFVTALDASERTLVLHDLFRDALQEQLRRRHPQDVATLLRRAAATTRDPLRRIAMLLRLPDPPAAQAELAACAELLFVRGDVAQVERTIAAFDPAWRAGSATLQRLSAMAGFLRWEWTRTARDADAALRAALAAGDEDERRLAQAYLANALYPLDRNDEAQALVDALHGERAQLAPPARLLTLMADASQHLRRGDLPALPGLYAQVLELLETSGVGPYRWWEGAPAINWTTLPGMRRLIERYLAAAWARVGDEPLPMVADLRLLEAFHHLWAGRLADAQAAAQQAEQDLRWLAVGGEAQVSLTLFRLLDDALHGRAQAARDGLQRLLEREAGGTDATRMRRWRHEVAIYGVRVADLLGGDADEIAQWAALLRENPLVDPASSNARANFVRARHAAARQRWADAAALMQPLLARAARMDVMGQAIELALRCAHAMLRAGRLDDAAAALQAPLQRIARDGELGQALLAGPLALRTLADTRWGARLDTVAQQTLRQAAQMAEQVRGDAAPRGAGELGDSGLSERERQVLQAIARGLPNKLIAREFDISPHTVKRHVANILDKLNLPSRGQAAAWLHAHDDE